MQRWTWNLANGFNFRIINSLWNLGGYAWPGLTVSYGNNPNCAIKIAVTISKTTKAALFTFVQVASEIAATFNIIAILCAVGDARCTLGNHERTRPRIWSPYPTIRLRLYTAKFVVRASIEKLIQGMKLRPFMPCFYATVGCASSNRGELNKIFAFSRFCC